MNLLDIIVLTALVVAFILGFKDGFIRKLIGTLGFFIAIFVSIYFSATGGEYLNTIFGDELYFSQMVAGFLIFMIIMLSTSILKRLIHPSDKVNNMINRIIGGAVGVVQFTFFLSALFFIINIFKLPSEETKENSFTYSLIATILPTTIDYITAFSPDAKDTIKNIIIEKDSL